MASPYTYRIWTNKEERWLIDNYGKQTIAATAKILGRTYSSVAAKCKQLRIADKYGKEIRNKYCRVEIKNMILMGRLPYIIAERLGCSTGTLRRIVRNEMSPAVQERYRELGRIAQRTANNPTNNHMRDSGGNTCME